MQERIVGAALGGVRLVLVVAALAVAIVPIGRSALTGFCPPAGAVEDAAGPDGGVAAARVAASGGPGRTSASAPTVVLAAPRPGLATIVEPEVIPTDDVPAPTSTEEAPAGDGGAPTDGATDDEAPGDAGTEPDGTGGSGDDAPCAGGVERCLPPLVSAVVSFGGGPCGGEALEMLQASMLPAFGIATVLLAGAWALRPRHGHGVLSRW